jgi:hypothetical protein
MRTRHLVREPARGGVLWGQVPHGRAVFERGEDHVVGEELVQVGVGKAQGAEVVQEHLVRRDALVDDHRLAAVKVVDA